MQDIYIDNVILQNCRGHYEMEMDFPMDCFTVIQGKNGAGKSTIPKAISMALFGDDGAPSGDKILITDMVNRKKGKDLEIKVFFRIVDSEKETTDEYRVELYYEHKQKHNQLLLFKNEVPISEKTKGDTYKKIESLLYPKDIYHNVIYFSQQVKNFFTSLTNSEQKQIFDAILQTKIYNSYYQNALNVERQLQDLVNNVTSEILSLEKELVLHKETLAMLESTKAKSEKDNQRTLAETKATKANIENQIQLVDDSVQSIEFYADEYEKLKADLIKVNQLISNMEHETEDKIRQLEKQGEHEFREIEMEINTKLQADIDKIRSKTEKEKEILSKKITEVYEKISEIAKKYDVTPINKDCANFESEKRKELQTVSFEINQLDSEYSTSKLEFERDERLKIIDRNIQELRDKASNLKEQATGYKSDKDKLEEEVRKDEEGLSGDVAICQKCLRPFSDKDNTGAIQNSISKNKALIAELNSNIEKCKNEMAELKKEFEDSDQVRSKAKSDYDDQIKAKIQSKEQRVSELQRKQGLINQEIEEYRKQSDQKIQSMRQKMDAETQTLRQEKEKLESEVRLLENSLEQEKLKYSELSDKETQNKKLEYNKKYSDLRAKLVEKLDNECKEHGVKFEDLKDKISRLEALKVRIDKLEEQKKELEYELKSLNSRISESENYTFDCTQIENTTFRINQVENGLQENKNRESVFNRELEIIRFWKVGFSDTGIKSMLIDMAIPHMNEAVSEALERMAPGIFTVSFDTLRANKAGDISDKFTVNVLHNQKGTDSHKMLSGGEKRIVDLACMEALRSLAERLYGKKIHNIFYDEVLDSLDEDNRQIFCQYSRVISRDKNVTLITHNTAEDMEPDRIFKF